MAQMWRIEGGELTPLDLASLDAESQLHDWLENDIALLDPQLLVIGREVSTYDRARIDLLAIDAEGALSIIELKRDRTPREVVAQVLDYASWVAALDTRKVHEIASAYWTARGAEFTAAFIDKFGKAPPEPLNTTHRMVIVASYLDPASKRIVEYLAQQHDVGINTAFFRVFTGGGQRFLSADWLMDQEAVVERTTARMRAPDSGVLFVNVGDGPHRSWQDMQRYGFVAAGGGRKYSAPLARLAVGDRLYAYQRGAGYVGFGTVAGGPVMARDASFEGTPLFDLPLQQPGIKRSSDDEELAEYVVPVTWHRTVSIDQAKTFSGVFANQHIVCKLNEPKTLQFLEREFGSRD